MTLYAKKSDVAQGVESSLAHVHSEQIKRVAELEAENARLLNLATYNARSHDLMPKGARAAVQSVLDAADAIIDADDRLTAEKLAILVAPLRRAVGVQP